MRILVLGATGRMGSVLLKTGMALGHEMVAYVRNPMKLKFHPNAIYVGELYESKKLNIALLGVDVVISALGDVAKPGRKSSVRSRAMETMLPVMEKMGVKRVMTIGASGILDHPNGGLRKDTPGYPKAFIPGADDHERVWEMLRELPENWDWWVLCPPELLAGNATQQVLIEVDTLPEGAKTSVFMEDVANFMFRELDNREFLRARIGIASPSDN